MGGWAEERVRMIELTIGDGRGGILGRSQSRRCVMGKREAEMLRSLHPGCSHCPSTHLHPPPPSTHHHLLSPQTPPWRTMAFLEESRHGGASSTSRSSGPTENVPSLPSSTVHVIILYFIIPLIWEGAGVIQCKCIYTFTLN